MSSIVLQPVDLSLDGWTKTSAQVAAESDGKGLPAKMLETPISKLTTERVDGDGAFDILMRSTKIHLQEEFESQRITGSEYATVYLGALTAVLQTSIQFLLNEQQVRKLNAEIGLIRQQTVTELSQTDDSVPQGLGFNFIPENTVGIPPVEGA